MENSNVIYKKGGFDDIDWQRYVTLTGDGKAVSASRVTAEATAKNGKSRVTFFYRNSDGETVKSATVTLYFYYEVCDLTTWFAVNDDLAAWYAQTADLDFSQMTFDSDTFVSVAREMSSQTYSSLSFTGVYDGNGYCFKNIADTARTVATDSDEVYGLSLFGAVGKGGVVRNVTLDNVKMYSRNYTGLLVGKNSGEIFNVYVKNCEVYNMYGAGALIAANNAGTICFVLLENNVHLTDSTSGASAQYVVSRYNTGYVAEVVCSGMTFLKGKSSRAALSDVGNVCDAQGSVVNFNGKDTTDFTAAGNVALSEVDFANYRFPSAYWTVSADGAVPKKDSAARKVTFDLNEWMVQKSSWATGDPPTHGGVIPDNVTLDEEGNAVLIVNGDLYEGEKVGYNANGYDYAAAKGGTRTGADLKSKKTYNYGTFEVVMTIPSFNGICTSMWLFNYFDSETAGEDAHNYEIDIEIHGTRILANGTAGTGNLNGILCTSWLTESNYESKFASVGYDLADGNFHAYRFDWLPDRIDYYVDGVLVLTQTGHVPTNEMYLNIGCWFPNGWCGDPSFETDYCTVKSFTYTPYEGEEQAGTVKTDVIVGNSGIRPWIDLPEKNLLANASFDDSRSNFVWTTTGTFENNVLNGTLTQTVEMDCNGVEYVLSAVATGDVTVTVTYGSLAEDVTVTGSVSGKNSVTFTPPENCTVLTVTLSGENVTLSSARLVTAEA